jgi:DNA-binding response OmpR family regulator
MKKIALIEDDEFILDFVSKQLDEAGYQISICVDGEKALDHVVEQVPDLILLDLDLPNVNGRQIMQDIKQNQAINSIPIVIFSNNDDPNLVKELIDLGASDYYLKASTNPEDLVALIGKHL